MGLETLSYAAFSHPPIFYCEKCGLTLLCCCSPAYAHDDTELLEN